MFQHQHNDKGFSTHTHCSNLSHDTLIVGSLLKFFVHCYVMSYGFKISEWGFFFYLCQARFWWSQSTVAMATSLTSCAEKESPSSTPKLVMVTIATSRTKQSLKQGVCVCYNCDCKCLMVSVSTCNICVCVFVCSGEVIGTEYVTMRPSEKERSSQSGRKSLTLHFLSHIQYHSWRLWKSDSVIFI